MEASAPSLRVSGPMTAGCALWACLALSFLLSPWGQLQFAGANGPQNFLGLTWGCVSPPGRVSPRSQGVVDSLGHGWLCLQVWTGRGAQELCQLGICGMGVVGGWEDGWVDKGWMEGGKKGFGWMEGRMDGWTNLGPWTQLLAWHSQNMQSDRCPKVQPVLNSCSELAPG